MDAFPHVPKKHYKDIRHEIKSGDILLCSGTSTISTLIQAATRSVWSHVGFVLRIDEIDRVMVLESVESVGVRTIPLSSYIADYNGTRKGYPGQVMLARHDDAQHVHISQLSSAAINLLGYPYDTAEILRIAARISLHALGFPDPHPTGLEPERAFICAEYAHVCFKSVGIHIEHNEMDFISPADFARNPKIKPISFLVNDNEKIIRLPVPFREHQMRA